MAEFMTIELCSIVGRREKRRMPGIHIYKRIWRNWQTRQIQVLLSAGVQVQVLLSAWKKKTKVKRPSFSFQDAQRPRTCGSRSPLRSGRSRANVHWTSCGLRFAPVGAKPRSPGPRAVSASLRSAQSRGPPDLVRSPLRFGRRKAEVPRTSCALLSARKKKAKVKRPQVFIICKKRNCHGRKV